MFFNYNSSLNFHTKAIWYPTEQEIGKEALIGKEAAYIFLFLNSIVFKIIPAAFEKNYSLLVPKF